MINVSFERQYKISFVIQKKNKNFIKIWKLILWTENNIRLVVIPLEVNLSNDVWEKNTRKSHLKSHIIYINLESLFIFSCVITFYPQTEISDVFEPLLTNERKCWWRSFVIWVHSNMSRLACEWWHAIDRGYLNYGRSYHLHIDYLSDAMKMKWIWYSYDTHYHMTVKYIFFFKYDIDNSIFSFIFVLITHNIYVSLFSE